MIRIYFALSILALTGAALHFWGGPGLALVGRAEILIAILGLHAHYTQE